MKPWTRWTAALAALTILLAPLPIRADDQVRNGQSLPSSGAGASGPRLMGDDGSLYRALKTDPLGILRVTEEYPVTNQFTSQTIATNASVFWCKFTTLQPLGVVWTAYPYGQKVLNITRASTGTNPSSALIYVFGSEDNFTFRPVMITRSGATAGNVADYSDSTTMDTLKILLPKRGSGGNSALGYSFTFPAGMYLGRYVQLYATKSDTAASSNVTITAQWGAREL